MLFFKALVSTASVFLCLKIGKKRLIAIKNLTMNSEKIQFLNWNSLYA